MCRQRKYSAPGPSRMAVGTTTRPATAASTPGRPPNGVPTYTAMLTWFGPGISRQSVSALRNSSCSIQRRRSTSTRCAHAERPPPKLASATTRKATASATGVGRGPSCPMGERGVIRQLADVVRVGGEWIGSCPALRLVPVVVEELPEALDDYGVAQDHAQLAAQVEGAAIEVHRSHERPLAVDEQELRVHLQMLLAVHLDVAALEDAERREGVVHVPGTQAVLAAAQDAHVHAAGLGVGEPVDDGGVDELRVLDVQGVSGPVDEAGDQASRVVGTPDERGVLAGMVRLA